MSYARPALRGLIVLATVVLGACGGEGSGLPQGEPTAVVLGAPDRTLATRTAGVSVAGPTSRAEGRVDFDTGRATLRREGQAQGERELDDPVVALDLVRGAVSVHAYGGAEVRGVSTMRYELEISPEQVLAAAPAGRRQALEPRLASAEAAVFYADVFIDGDGCIRRVSVPIDLTEQRPSRSNRILARLVTVDFFDFGSGPGSGGGSAG